VKRATLFDVNWVVAELRPDSFHARAGDHGVDLIVERDAERRLTPESAARIVEALNGLIRAKSWLARVKLVCALDSRGLILRPFPRPTAVPSEIARCLQLQLEGELPLPPEDLAWGWIPRPVPDGKSAAGERPEVLVAAVRKDVVVQLAAVLKPIATDLVFTPATLARLALIPAENREFSLLDLGNIQCELTVVEVGSAPSVRWLSWGVNRLTDSVGNIDPSVDSSGAEEVERLLALMPAAVRKFPLWIAGPPEVAARLVRLLAAHWGGESLPQVLVIPVGPGHTAALTGLAQILARNRPSAATQETPGVGAPSAVPLMELQSKLAEANEGGSRRLPSRSLLALAALFALVLLVPYLEALLFQPRLARRIAEFKKGNAQLAIIDREFSFLRYLEQNQAPHLDAAFVIAQAAPPGARVQSININRQGEVSLSGWLRDLAQVGTFRLKLIDSGFFSTVVVEDQSPTPDRQRINFRINARWKDAAEREALSLGPELINSVGTSSSTNQVLLPPGSPRPSPAGP